MNLQIAPVSFNDNLCVKRQYPLLLWVGECWQQDPSRALTGNSAFWNGNEAECIAGLHLRDSHVERPSGCKNVRLSIIKEASGNRVPTGAKVENCICVTYPRASPMQPMSNCCFKQGKWSWHDKLRQNKSVGWRSANLWDTEAYLVPGRACA